MSMSCKKSIPELHWHQTKQVPNMHQQQIETANGKHFPIQVSRCCNELDWKQSNQSSNNMQRQQFLSIKGMNHRNILATKMYSEK